ncbi:MAG: glycosyltransferase family 2 protein [Clostridia bacterium]|nr:glycosyltransferase family 2 protein [Clostridia bacterium]
MFFSVIVPVYKVEDYLPSCIDSILNQTFDDYEIILVDDGSPDSCPEICDRFSGEYQKIRVIHKENGGLASARIAGIKIAQGDYVFNLDSDDLIENDTLEYAHKIICETNCEILSFAYKWIKGSKVVSVTNDGLEEGLYRGKDIEKHIYTRLLMDKNMNHISYYLSGKAIKREFLLPNQLGVNEKISLGEDLCCVISCYLKTQSVYISKKEAYFYTVREDSLSKDFNANQICLVENVIEEIQKNETEKISDFDDQLNRYSAFMCFAILASAAEGDYFKSIKNIKSNIDKSVHKEKIQRAKFDKISVKSRISILLMKKNMYKTAFCFLNLCKNIKKFVKRG